MEPWSRPLLIDWVVERVQQAGQVSYNHYAEPAHATEAITSAAEDVIREHNALTTDTPLFLYVAFTAAHSPLQPLPRHESACTHIPHLWR
jgi:arylsulfatase A-like enzyme